MYSTNNFRYLRVSKTNVLPLNLILAKEDLSWFSDYTFQEILSVLKPLLLSRIELYNRGHIIKRAIVPSTFINVYQDQDNDGLEDAGVILGGDSDTRPVAAASSLSAPISTGTKGGRRKGLNTSGSGDPSNRPQFSVRFGMRPSTTSERSGSILAAEKNLGFSKVKKEQVDDDDDGILTGSRVAGSQRSRMELATLEGEGVGDDVDRVSILQEDESDSLRVRDFQSANEEGNNDDSNYVDSNSKSKQAAKRKGRGKRTRADTVDAPSSQVDEKPTLQVAYNPLRLHPQTLYIVVRTLGMSSAQASSSILPFMVSKATSGSPLLINSATAVSDSNSDASIAPSSEAQEDEESLFPPGMDYFQ
ncbi:hypothetical protein BGZ98_008306 [Dissophora globulifera]|nr:hypothetical protein BGZ98_008306 [Dissophora globulifera]